MGKVKPWQIVVIVLAVVAIGTSFYFTFFGGEKTNLRSSVRMFDVNTGDSMEMGFGKGGATFPGLNPKTQKISMLPIQKGEDGKWYIVQRYLSALKQIEGPKTAVVNEKTGEVRATD